MPPSPSSHEFIVGDGAAAEAGPAPAAEATSQRSLPHAKTPNASQTPEGECTPDKA